MAIIKFLYDNYIDDSTTTITALSAHADYPASNIQEYSWRRHYRSTGDAAEWLKFDLGSALAIKVIAIRYHNLTGAATLTLEGNATDAVGAWTYTQVISITSDKIIYFLASTQTFRWWRLTIADGANPDTIIKIGRVFLGSYFMPSHGPLVPRRKTNIDPSVKQRASGGGPLVEEEDTFEVMAYVWTGHTSADHATFQTMFETVGTKKPFFVCENSAHATPYTVTYYIEALNEDWEMGVEYEGLHFGPVIECAEVRE